MTGIQEHTEVRNGNKTTFQVQYNLAHFLLLFSTDFFSFALFSAIDLVGIHSEFKRQISLKLFKTKIPKTYFRIFKVFLVICTLLQKLLSQ